MTHWEIEQGRVDSVAFLRSLPHHFPDANVLFVEGTSVTPDVARCYRSRALRGYYHPGRQTIAPRSEIWKCGITPAFLEELSVLAERHAGPELADHLFLYRIPGPHGVGEAVLEWPDAFHNPITVAGFVPETTVAAFAGDHGLGYRRVTDP